MEWDPIDDEIRQELERICLDDSDSNSSPSPQPVPPHTAKEADISALFRGYLEVTECGNDVFSEVNDLLHTSSHEQPSCLEGHDPTPLSSLEGHRTPKLLSDLKHQDYVELSETSDLVVLSNNLNTENSDNRTHTKNEESSESHELGELAVVIDESFACTKVDKLLGESEPSQATQNWERQQLLEAEQMNREQLEKEFELNAIIVERQRRLEERKKILVEREQAKAAVKLQAHIRGYLTRLGYRELLTVKKKAAIIIQAQWRGCRARKKSKSMIRSITLIQRTWRKHNYRRTRERAVLCIQKHWRAQKKLAKKRELAESVKAARQIQKAWRAYRYRCELRLESALSLAIGRQTPDSSTAALPSPLHLQSSTILIKTESIPQNDQSWSELPLSSEVEPRPTQQNETKHKGAQSNLPTIGKSELIIKNAEYEAQHSTTPEANTLQMGNPAAQSPNKLTISKRIQSSLRLVNHSSSTHMLGAAGRDALWENRSFSLPTTMRRSISGSEWSQLKVDRKLLASVLASNDALLPNKLANDLKKQNKQSKCEDSGSRVEEDLVSTKSALEQATLNQDQTLKPHSTVYLNTSYRESSTGFQQLKDALSSEGQLASVERESLALQGMRERRQQEMVLADQSRVRMSSLASEDEIQQVAKQKQAHAAYNSELEFAAQPLSPKAWCGLVTERLELWKRTHKAWVMPSHCTPSSQSSQPHPPLTGTPLTNAQIVAASPKGISPEQVAMVMMYRSRLPVDLKGLAKCPRLSSLSLTKCGLVSLSRLEGCTQLKEIKVQSNSIEHLDLAGLNELGFVDISDNRLASIHGLQSCNQLLSLDLSENRIARLAGLEGCHNLQRLTVDGNLIINSKGLCNVPLLQWFSCSENHLPRVEGLEYCSLLQHLALAQNNLQQAPLLCDHVLLRELHLDGNSLSDLGPLSKAWLPLLQTLSLANNCITELTSLVCMVMLERLDVGNNSLYDLPVFLQCVRGCYQLQVLVVSGNPISEERKHRYYITKALPCLESLDDKPLKKMAKIPDMVSSSSVCVLSRRQIVEQDAAKQKLEQPDSGDGPPSPDSVVQALRGKVAHCNDYQTLLINHLREHEQLEMRDGLPPSPLPGQKLSRQTRAAVKIQSAWRGALCRKRVERLRQEYHRAATLIQASYRGYSLRVRLRMVLEAARYTKEGVAHDGEGRASDDSLDFEEEIVVDFLDESALDNELGPLSPREPVPRRCRHSSLTDMPIFQAQLQTEGPLFQGRLQTEHPLVQGRLQTDTSLATPAMVPLYSLPGCVQEEVTFEDWKKQQVTPRENIRETSSVKGTFGAPLISEGGEVVRGNPLAAWESTTDLDMDKDVQKLDDKTEKVDRIINEWGLQSSSTAELMLKRAKRQKMLHTKAARRKKLADPTERLAAFRKKAPPTHVLRAQELFRDQSPVTQSSSPQPREQGFVYQWVNNHALVHERDPLFGNIQRGSILPPMEPRVLAGHTPQLVQSSGNGDHQIEVQSTSSQGGNYKIKYS